MFATDMIGATKAHESDDDVAALFAVAAALAQQQKVMHEVTAVSAARMRISQSQECTSGWQVVGDRMVVVVVVAVIKRER